MNSKLTRSVEVSLAAALENQTKTQTKNVVQTSKYNPKSPKKPGRKLG